MIENQQDLYLLSDTEEARGANEHIIRLLDSTDESNVRLAFQLIEGGGVSLKVRKRLRGDDMLGKLYCIHTGLPFSSWHGTMHSTARYFFIENPTFEKFIKGEIKPYELYARFAYLYIGINYQNDGSIKVVDKCKSTYTRFISVASMIEAIKNNLKHSMFLGFNIQCNGCGFDILETIDDAINTMEKPTNCKVTCKIW